MVNHPNSTPDYAPLAQAREEAGAITSAQGKADVVLRMPLSGAPWPVLPRPVPLTWPGSFGMVTAAGSGTVVGGASLFHSHASLPAANIVVAGAGRGSVRLRATAEAPPWLAVSSITVSVGGGYRASS